MDTTDSAPQVETASPSPAPATAPDAQVSATVDTTSSSPSQELQEAEAQLRAFYSPEPATAGAEEEKTGEQAQTTEQPQAQPEDHAAKAEEQAKAAEAEEQSKGRYRLKGPDALIAAIAKEKGISLADAADLYRGKPAATPATTIPGMEAQPAAPAKPAVLTALEEQVGNLTREIEEAEKGEDYLSPEYARKTRQLASLEGDLRLARYQYEQAEGARQRGEEQNRATATEHAQETSRAEIVKAYPDIADGKTALGKAAQEVIAELEGTPEGRALLDGPDSPERILAKALLRAPQAPAAPATATKPAASAPPSSQTPNPSTPPPVRRVTAAPGSRGQATPGKPSSVAEVFASIDTAEQGNEALRQLYGGESKGQRRGS